MQKSDFVWAVFEKLPVSSYLLSTRAKRKLTMQTQKNPTGQKVHDLGHFWA
jgi:hypothetical protein